MACLYLKARPAIVITEFCSTRHYAKTPQSEGSFDTILALIIRDFRNH